MKKLWFLKGTTGLLLRDMKAEGTPPFTVRYRSDFPGCPMVDDSGGRGSFRFAFSIRGNSKQRRQQRRQIERWLNEQPTTE